MFERRLASATILNRGRIQHLISCRCQPNGPLSENLIKIGLGIHEIVYYIQIFEHAYTGMFKNLSSCLVFRQLDLIKKTVQLKRCETDLTLFVQFYFGTLG